MYTKTKVIVLSSIKYQEKSLIVTCYTQSHGMQRFFVPTAFSSKKSNQKIAYFQPLTLLEIEVNFKKKEGLHYFKHLTIDTPYYSISHDIFKNTIVLLLSEVLYTSLQETDEDYELFEFLKTALIWLDTHDEIANFHIMLLLKLTKFLGFYPDVQSFGFYFDLLNGTFVHHKDVNSISEADTNLIKRLLNLNFDSDQKVFNGKERQQLLEILFNYYTLHLDRFRKPKSLDVFKEFFR